MRRPLSFRAAVFGFVDAALACTMLLPWVGAEDFAVPGVGLPSVGELIVAVGNADRWPLVPLYLVYIAFAAAIVGAALRIGGRSATARTAAAFEIVAAVATLAVVVFLLVGGDTTRGIVLGFWLALGVAVAVGVMSIADLIRGPARGV